ncbi:MAG: hypothetical protein TECD_01242 [Hyphomicrobiaceae bacterium hypho_1]
MNGRRRKIKFLDRTRLTGRLALFAIVNVSFMKISVVKFTLLTQLSILSRYYGCAAIKELIVDLREYYAA